MDVTGPFFMKLVSLDQGRTHKMFELNASQEPAMIWTVTAVLADLQIMEVCALSVLF